MHPILEYRTGGKEVSHPWPALLLAGGLGLSWGVAPLCIFLSTGESILSKRVLLIMAWCMLIGVAAGVHTVWTRRRSDGAETPLGLVGIYYFAIVLFWVGVSGFKWVEYRPWDALFGWSVLRECIADNLRLLLNLTGYGTVLGLIAIPICYLCREQVWRTYR